jgi:prepilin-type N-terminal cleavage/methylation domain-containing protein
MKNDGLVKNPSCRMNAQHASWGGSETSRIHLCWRGSHATGVTAFRRPEGTFCGVNKRNSGYTLIELLIVMSILGLLTSFAVPAFLESLNNSRATSCLILRQNIQVAADVYIRMNALQVDNDMPTIATLVSEGILPDEHKCPSGGIYVWNNAKYKGMAQPFFLYCSVHFAAP